VLNDDLFDYLTREKGFSVTYYVGDQKATGRDADWNPSNALSPVLPWASDQNADGQPQTEALFVFSSAQAGDVVFYHQKHAPYVERGGQYNHAAFATGWGSQTSGGDLITGVGPSLSARLEPFVPGTTLHIADHSSPASKWGVRAINDTWSEVNMLAIVHIPAMSPRQMTQTPNTVAEQSCLSKGTVDG
jgi:hypothetical protein